LKFPCDKCEYKAPLPHTLKQHKLTAHEASAYYLIFCKKEIAADYFLLHRCRSVLWKFLGLLDSSVIKQK
jgi:hypothetical protein